MNDARGAGSFWGFADNPDAFFNSRRDASRTLVLDASFLLAAIRPNHGEEVRGIFQKANQADKILQTLQRDHGVSCAVTVTGVEECLFKITQRACVAEARNREFDEPWERLYRNDHELRTKVLASLDSFLKDLRERKYYILELEEKARPSGVIEQFPLTSHMRFYMGECALVSGDALVLAIAAKYNFWILVTMDRGFEQAREKGFAILFPNQ